MTCIHFSKHSYCNNFAKKEFFGGLVIFKHFQLKDLIVVKNREFSFYIYIYKFNTIVLAILYL